jgi:DNA-binding winged helix-turn-helix (wHTH) protein/TolB-like protein
MSEPLPQIYEFDEFRIDVSKRLLAAREAPIPLTPKVFDTLLYLVRNSGKVIGKDELMREIWSDSIVEENNLNQNISILRKVFGEKPGEQRFIVTVAGLGYRFVPTVRPIVDIKPESDTPTRMVEVKTAGESQRLGAPPVAQLPPKKSASYLRLLAVISAVLVLGAAGFYLGSLDADRAGESVKSIGVLPFKPLVADNRNESLELGMADALIAKLSAGDFAVRPLSAIRRFNSLEQDPLAAGRELGVESILDGTIQNWGDRIRISAKLVRISDGKQLWADQFDERFTDIFAVQDAISQKVAAALKIRLVDKKKSPTENIEAYQLYMKGRYHTAKSTPPDLRASISYFQQAIDIDPEYALAYTGLARAYGVLGIFGEIAAAEAFPKARAAEQKALEIDDTLGEAHVALCMGLFWYDWDWASAERECVRGLEIDPNNADFHGHFAALLSGTGRHEEALAQAKRSRELDPLNLSQSALEGQFLLHAGRVDEAIERLRKVSELEPAFPFPHVFAASAFIEKGMFEEAIVEARTEYELTGRNEIPFGAYAMAKLGRQQEARAVLNDLLKQSATKYVSPYNVALIYSGLDESANALDWLEKGYALRDPKMTFLKVEPKWNNLRNEARFVDLIRRMNFQ